MKMCLYSLLTTPQKVTISATHGVILFIKHTATLVIGNTGKQRIHVLEHALLTLAASYRLVQTGGEAQGVSTGGGTADAMAVDTMWRTIRVVS